MAKLFQYSCFLNTNSLLEHFWVYRIDFDPQRKAFWWSVLWIRLLSFMHYPEAGLCFIVVLSVPSDREGHFNIVFVPAEHSSIKYSVKHERKTKQDRKPESNFSWPSHTLNWQSLQKVLLCSHLLHKGQSLEFWESLKGAHLVDLIQVRHILLIIRCQVFDRLMTKHDRISELNNY